MLWERGLEKSWEVLEEDEDGFLTKKDNPDTAFGGVQQQGASGLPRAPRAPLQRGLLRNLIVVLDASLSMEQTDWRPRRMAAVGEAVVSFVRSFFDANPISSLGLVRCRNGTAEKLTSLSGSPAAHIVALRSEVIRPCACDPKQPCRPDCGRRGAGEFSFENSLEFSLRLLCLQPSCATREILVVHSALSSCDPGDVYAAGANCKGARVRVSTISLPGEVYVATRLAGDTGGTARVPLSEGHLGDLLRAHCAPPARSAAEAAAVAAAGMLAVGFPQLVNEAQALCACHGELRASTYICPRCRTHVCDVPSECPSCALRLIHAPAIASSYHHIFPAPPFVALVQGAGGRGGSDGGGSGAGGGGASRKRRRGAGGEEEGEGAEEEEEEEEEEGEGEGERRQEEALAQEKKAVLPLCTACVVPLHKARAFKCPNCALPFCDACENFVAQSLFSCPGCPESAFLLGGSPSDSTSK